jgi:hypothetical protein
MLMCVPAIVGYAILGNVEFCAAVRRIGSESLVPENQLSRTIASLKVLQGLFRSCGVVGGLLGVVLAMHHLDDPPFIGPSMAFSLLSISYGVIISELVIGIRVTNYVRLAFAHGVSAEVESKSHTFVIGFVSIAFLNFVVLLFSLGSIAPHQQSASERATDSKPRSDHALAFNNEAPVNLGPNEGPFLKHGDVVQKHRLLRFGEAE